MLVDVRLADVFANKTYHANVRSNRNEYVTNLDASPLTFSALRWHHVLHILKIKLDSFVIEIADSQKARSGVGIVGCPSPRTAGDERKHLMASIRGPRLKRA